MTFKPTLDHGQPAWSTGKVSSCLPASTQGDGAIKALFNMAARIPFLCIPGLNEHHAHETGFCVCLDQKEKGVYRMFQGT